MLGDISLDVTQKNIRHIRLCVYPPHGQVRISAPLRMGEEDIKSFAASKLDWIKKQQSRFSGQNYEAPKRYTDGESHYFFGSRYLLKVIEHNSAPRVAILNDTLELRVKPNTGLAKKREAVEKWYRQQLKEVIPEYIARYENTMQVTVSSFGIKKMKTRWGTCNSTKKRIWLNLELAKKPMEYIDYLVAHEMTHLLERGHNKRFKSLMDQFLPNWRLIKKGLNGPLNSNKND
jgi:hypothetical protein